MDRNGSEEDEVEEDEEEQRHHQPIVGHNVRGTMDGQRFRMKWRLLGIQQQDKRFAAAVVNLAQFTFGWLVLEAHLPKRKHIGTYAPR